MQGLQGVRASKIWLLMVTPHKSNINYYKFVIRVIFAKRFNKEASALPKKPLYMRSQSPTEQRHSISKYVSLILITIYL